MTRFVDFHRSAMFIVSEVEGLWMTRLAMFILSGGASEVQSKDAFTAAAPAATLKSFMKWLWLLLGQPLSVPPGRF
jgi:hypothetical protein